MFRLKPLFNYKINIKGINNKLTLHPASLVYLSDLNPERVWDLRGYSGHQRQNHRLNEIKKAAIKTVTNNQNFQEQLSNFLDPVLDIFSDLRAETSPALGERVPDFDFYFVIGHMRSGGTFLLRRLLNCHGLRLKKFNQGMIHDGCPSYRELRTWHHTDSSDQLVFELAQFIYWASRVFADQGVVIKKRIAFAHALPLLHRIFGDRAHYLITIRDPEESAESFRELEDIDVVDSSFSHSGWKEFVLRRFNVYESTWDSLGYYQKYLYHWTAYYYDIVRNFPENARLIPLVYGDDYNNYLQEHRAQFPQKSQPNDLDDFNQNDRDHGQYMDRRNVSRSLEFLEEKWAEKDLLFPLV